jgi:hypothetical protein
MSMIREVEASRTAISHVAARVLAGTQADISEQDLQDLVSIVDVHGARLGARWRDELAVKITTRTGLEDVLRGLRSLDVTPIEATVRALLAYLLKYRYVDLTDFSSEWTTLGPSGAGLMWALPDGYDSIHADMRSRLTASPTPVMKKLVVGFKSAPWLGKLDDVELIQGVAWLSDLGLVEFAHDHEVRAAGSSATGVPVLRLSALYDDIRTRRWLDVASHEEKQRRSLVSDRGIGLRAIGAAETFRMFKDASTNDIVKIATYHFRTVIGDRSLADWLNDNPSLRVQIMCLGPTSRDELTEGADPDSLAESLIDGIHGFHGLMGRLPASMINRIEIRVYGDVPLGGLFRGAILCDAGSSRVQVKRVVATAWPFGELRANYGEVLVLESSSNISQLVNEYYDNAWADAVPLAIGKRLARTRWALSTLRGELAASAGLGIIATIIFLQDTTELNSDAFFALLGIALVLVSAIHRIVQRLWRAGRLSVKVRGRERYR